MDLLHQITYLATNYYPLLIQGIINTILLALIGTFFGTLIGLFLAILKTWEIHFNDTSILKFLKRFLKILASIYVDIVRGTPMMVQAAVFYYGIAYMGININPLTAGFVVISFNTSAYICEIIISGINAINKGQNEAASSLGLSHFYLMRYIILPQVFINSLPALMNEFIVNIKDSSVLNIIGVSELFYAAKGAASATYMNFAAYLLAAIIYLILTKSLTVLFKYLVNKYQYKKMSLPQSQTVPEVV